jgi:DNA-binding transcriptional regulator LsrR (DeoR family)
MKSKGRSLVQKGDLNHGRKLSFEDVKYIRHLYFAERAAQPALAKMFGISRPNISLIVNRRSWNY